MLCCTGPGRGEVDMSTILLLGLGGLMLLALAARAFSSPLRVVVKAAVNMLLGIYPFIH